MCARVLCVCRAAEATAAAIVHSHRTHVDAARTRTSWPRWGLVAPDESCCAHPAEVSELALQPANGVRVVERRGWVPHHAHAVAVVLVQIGLVVALNVARRRREFEGDGIDWDENGLSGPALRAPVLAQHD